jgi:hydroxymethylbilane synthase
VRLRLGTRGSALALWQARHAVSRLGSLHPGLDVEIVVLKTEGDRFTDAALTAAGGRGVFVREIEEAILAGTIDAGVHSLKDLPTDVTPGTALAAILRRGDPRDALVARGARSVAELPVRAVVATGSPRRRGQLRAARPDLAFVDVRGNVDTRLRKLGEGSFGALVLAVAGLERLEVDRGLWTAIPTEVCLPAPGQGALAIQTRADDGSTRALVAALDDADTAHATTAERAFLAALGAGCLAPAGALAQVHAGVLTIEAVVATPDGTRLVRQTVSGSQSDAEGLGVAVAAEVLDAGGDAIVEASR